MCTRPRQDGHHERPGWPLILRILRFRAGSMHLEASWGRARRVARTGRTGLGLLSMLKIKDPSAELPTSDERATGPGNARNREHSMELSTSEFLGRCLR